jgi:hypothetical protein
VFFGQLGMGAAGALTVGAPGRVHGVEVGVLVGIGVGVLVGPGVGVSVGVGAGVFVGVAVFVGVGVRVLVAVGVGVLVGVAVGVLVGVAVGVLVGVGVGVFVTKTPNTGAVGARTGRIPWKYPRSAELRALKARIEATAMTATMMPYSTTSCPCWRTGSRRRELAARLHNTATRRASIKTHAANSSIIVSGGQSISERS